MASSIIGSLVELECILPEGTDVGSVAVGSGERVEEQLGLRCRFTRQKDEPQEFPGIIVPSKSSGSCVRCVCSPKVLEDKEMSVALVWGEDQELRCEGVKMTSALAKEELDNSQVDSPEAEVSAAVIIARMSWIDRYLAVWIFVTMLAGVLIGNYAPKIRKAWEVSKVDTVSLPIAIGLWWMMYPVLCKVRYEAMGRLLKERALARHIGLSLVLNWVIAPLLMTGLAWACLPDLSGYRNGVILVGIARCIAMVLLWNHLAGGNAEFCAVLVSINSFLQILLYSPLAIFYLKVISGGSSVHVSFWMVAKSVLLFLGVPLGAAILTRFALRAAMGEKWYDRKFTPWFGPTALLGLLFTIFVMFSLQGRQIVHRIPEVCRVAVPLMLYFAITFSSTMLLCRRLTIPYCDAVTQCFTASGNNFELAIAVAVASFGINSDEALAAVIGPLIEVPALIALVYFSLWVRTKLKWSSAGAILEQEEQL